MDEIRQGPFSRWHHEHHFEAIAGGTRIRDVVEYALPYGVISPIIHRFFVESQVAAMFEYRAEVLASFFGLISAVEMGQEKGEHES